MAKRYSGIVETIGKTPLFADVPADMTVEELAISRSTPGGQLKT